MVDLEEIHADLEADVTLEEFREAVAAKVEQMGGLADEETAAMLVAHELGETSVDGIGDIDAGQQEVTFVGKVRSVGELRSFEREDDETDGQVCNVELADETGTVRAAFWDEQAEGAANELAVGDTIRVKGRPRDGMNGVEVSVTDIERADDVEIDVTVDGTYTIDDLTLGLSDVTLQGRVLGTEPVRTFDRDDGTEGRVANLTLGDETGRVRVTLWDDRADRATELEPGSTVEVVDGYVRERDGDLEVHVGNQGAIDEVDANIEFVPDQVPIAAIDIDQTVDLAGVVRSADPKRTFERDDGSDGQVRNIRVQDDSGDIRVALWGEKADLEVGPGDEVALTDVEIQDGWQDDLEASAGWGSSVIVLDREVPEPAAPTDEGATALDAFSENGDDDQNADPTPEQAPSTTGSTEAESVEFTGVVVQAGEPVVLDDGDRTVTVETDADLGLGEEVTARGTLRDGRLEAEDVL